MILHLYEFLMEEQHGLSLSRFGVWLAMCEAKVYSRPHARQAKDGRRTSHEEDVAQISPQLVLAINPSQALSQVTKGAKAITSFQGEAGISRSGA